MNHTIFLIYDTSVFLGLASTINPVLSMAIAFIGLVVILHYKLEYCIALGAIFFASILRKYNNNVDYTTSLILTIPLIISYINVYIGAAVQVVFDYYLYPEFIRDSKFYNRFAVFISVTLWNGTLEETIAIILAFTAAHGVYLRFLINKNN